jgi:LL-diaminopimelate aminotransferase
MRQPNRRLTSLPGYPLAELPGIKRRLIEAGRDIIDLGAGDNDMPPPQEVVAAMREAVTDPAMSKYGFQQGLPEFRVSAAGYLERRFGVTVDPVQELLPMIGSKEGIAHLPFGLVEPGDIAIIPEPGYQAYLGGAVLAGADPCVVPLRAEEDFRVEIDALPADMLQRAAIVYLNYPNNPTTAVASLEYLERVVSACRRHDIVLVYDNPYCDLTFDEYVAPSVLEIPGAKDVAIEYFSLSKSFSMTGWRIGFVAGNRELIACLTKVKTYIDTGPFLAVQRAGCAALDEAERLVAPVVETLRERRDAAVQSLAAAGFDVTPPRATMYVWIPLPVGMSSAEFARVALEEFDVLVLPGSGFGPAGEGFFRIALTVSPARLIEASERLGRTLTAIQGGAVETRA